MSVVPARAPQNTPFRQPALWSRIKTQLPVDDAFGSTRQLMRRVGGNTGNMAFVAAANSLVAGIRCVNEVGADHDVRILCCANYLNPGRTPTTEVVHEMTTPVVAVGLGAQAPATNIPFVMPPEAHVWLSAVRALAPSEKPNIAVRGLFTLRAIEEAGFHGAAIALGCPSLFINPRPDLGRALSAKCAEPFDRIAVVPGNLRSTRHPEAERALARLAFAQGGGYIIQNPEEIVALVRDGAGAVGSHVVDKVRRASLPELSTSDFVRWLQRDGRYFFDLGTWIDFVSRRSFVIGSRIHGAMLALQAGTPALCISIDSRTEELCEMMRVPYMRATEFASGYSIEELYERVRVHDWIAFDRNRVELAARTSDFLIGNHITPSKKLAALAAAL